MARQEALAYYQAALKEGRRCYRERVHEGAYPYLPVLDEILADAETAGNQDLGLIDIPTELIVGTRTEGRHDAFAANFMPLMGTGTEFASKWVTLCEAHLGDTGITDPIVAFEYLGRFYVQEGNKRVSVLKSFGASSVHGHVTRVVPVWSQDMETRVYYEFMAFYAKSGTYLVHFRTTGGYAKLQAALGLDPGHVWDEDERRSFQSDFYRFRKAYHALGGASLPATTAEALLAWLQINPLSDLKDLSDERLRASLSGMWDEVEALSQGSPIAISADPEPEKAPTGAAGLVDRIKDAVLPTPVLKVAFVYMAPPECDVWVAAQDAGRREVERAFEGRVSTSAWCVGEGRDAEATVEAALADGADVLVGTSPLLIHACRRGAARHPKAHVLACGVSMPYPGVRTYQARMYEATFVLGTVAGALSQEGRVGYVAAAPLMTTFSEIDAFALGAQSVRPGVRVDLAWSGVHRDAFDRLVAAGDDVVMHADTSCLDLGIDYQGLCRVHDGSLTLLGLPTWHWGTFFAKIVGTVLFGAWDAERGRAQGAAVSYWWGLSADVFDVELTPDVPDGVRTLALQLRNDVAEGRLRIFDRPVVAQDGSTWNDGTRWLGHDDVLRMDFLCEGVEGFVPGFDELLPEARDLVRLQGAYREGIAPEKGAPQL